MKKEKETFCALKCSAALFIFIVTRSGAERRWKKSPGNILQCLVALFFISGTRSGAEMEERSRQGILKGEVSLYR